MKSSDKLIELRVRRFLQERLEAAVYPAAHPLDVAYWEVPDEPVAFGEAKSQTFREMSVGAPWGKPWGTVWFHVTGAIPLEWRLEGRTPELVCDLGFDKEKAGFQAEGLVWSPEGAVIKGVEPRNNHVVLTARAGDEIDLYVEAAANPDLDLGSRQFAPTGLGRKESAGTDPLYVLRRMDVVLRDVQAWELVQDVVALFALAAELRPGSTRRAEIMVALDRMVDAVDPDDVGACVRAARESLRPILLRPAHASAHRVFAVGHAHIDSAWLWPVRETVRKCARTFSNVLALMDQDPDLVFACSSAQQFAWIKENYPGLFERIRARVREGRFVPVGGMWVESDTNMPCGEALARQFMEGKQFFLDEFGVETREAWLPDSFGFSGALPQIIRASGSTRFLTQKPSWNELNVMPHSTFVWEGIDGSRVFTHFPPVNTYNSDLSPHDLARAERNYSEKGRGTASLVPFGFGDGGGGPTREMLAAAARARSLEGSPRVKIASPSAFFEEAEAEAEYRSPPVWVGELYLESHRGTYTSQARTKRGNRRCEVLLHEAELWATTAAVSLGTPYPYGALTAAWRTVLLQQFHDILPGASIGWVHDEAVENYVRIAASLDSLISKSCALLAGGGDEAIAFNASPFAVDGVEAMGAGSVVTGAGVAVERDAMGVTVSSAEIRLHIDRDGLIDSLVDAGTGREVVPEGVRGNILEVFRDTPSQWDAWNLDEEYRRTAEEVTALAAMDVVEDRVDRATIRIVRSFGHSTVVQHVSVSGLCHGLEILTEVDWHERQKLLKLSFPVDVHTTCATSEIQFGHITRPTHMNTSWDEARFEVPAHRWLHVSDAAFGVAVANDSVYGHDVTRHVRRGGGTYSVIRQSLLRAPLFPDPEADQGAHAMLSSLVIGGIRDAVQEGYRLNVPLRATRGHSVLPLVRSDNGSMVVETVKLAQDRSGDVVMRVYESEGARSQGTLTVTFGYDTVIETDLLERCVPRRSILNAGQRSVRLALDPFQLVTLRFKRQDSPGSPHAAGPGSRESSSPAFVL